MIPLKASLQSTEQSVNNVIMLRQFIVSVKPVYEALTGARSVLLADIREVFIAFTLHIYSTYTADESKALRTPQC